jgi:hypothetical protein
VIDWRDTLLGLHVVAGSLGLCLGAVAIIAERRPPFRSSTGCLYPWAVLATAATAVGLVAFDPLELWWLTGLAGLTYGLALLGYLAPRRRPRGWVRAYAHGQGGSLIALVTAALVVSLDGTAAAAAWIVPTLIGVPLIERRVTRISAQTTTSPRRIR